MSRIGQFAFGTLTVALLLHAPSFAGCNCSRGQAAFAGPVADPGFIGGGAPLPYGPGYSGTFGGAGAIGGDGAGAMAGGGGGPSSPVYAPSGYAPVNPPPGTLGWTYRRPSHLMPDDKQPRSGMLQVRGPAGAEDIIVDGMKGFLGQDGLYHFETNESMLPHRPHVYYVRALFRNGDYVTEEVRVVRLIPGRIVTLGF